MKKISTIAFVVVILCVSACSDFVEVEGSKTQIVTENVFARDAGARGAVSGIFSQMISGSAFASGNVNGMTVVGGVSSDELNIHTSTSTNLIALFNNNLTSLNSSAVSANWNDMYLYIYESNSIISGAGGSTTLSKAVKDQVIGEAKFVRAFCYFYLINLYGDVPLVTATDYRVNKTVSRTPMSEVYAQIEADLLDAQQLLLADYSFSKNEKVEPNKWAATALLARVYLYQKKWSQAEAQAAAVIDSQKFSLVANLNSVFLKNSTEAIWQLMPVFPGYNTNEGIYLVIASSPTRVSATNATLSVFEPGDSRAMSWIGSYTTGGKTYSYAYKYKIRVTNQPVTEYYTVLRFAEQYLIRAEARAMQNNFTGAVEDLNKIRQRAGLIAIDPAGLTQQQVLDKVAQERRAELFIEWGHRWFDLKRSGKIDAVMSAAKPNWEPKDALFPIPQAEINANPNIVQNP